MVQYRLKDVVKWLNMFPQKRGLYKTYSPREILTSKPVDYKKCYKIIFGSYGQAIHETNPTNITTPRTLGVVYLQLLDQYVSTKRWIIYKKIFQEKL